LPELNPSQRSTPPTVRRGEGVRGETFVANTLHLFIQVSPLLPRRKRGPGALPRAFAFRAPGGGSTAMRPPHAPAPPPPGRSSSPGGSAGRRGRRRKWSGRRSTGRPVTGSMAHNGRGCPGPQVRSGGSVRGSLCGGPLCGTALSATAWPTAHTPFRCHTHPQPSRHTGTWGERSREPWPGLPPPPPPAMATRRDRGKDAYLHVPNTDPRGGASFRGPGPWASESRWPWIVLAAGSAGGMRCGHLGRVESDRRAPHEGARVGLQPEGVPCARGAACGLGVCLHKGGDMDACSVCASGLSVPPHRRRAGGPRRGSSGRRTERASAPPPGAGTPPTRATAATGAPSAGTTAPWVKAGNGIADMGENR